MENKYYTPNIEEFYDGFEYEFKHTSRGWIPFVFGKVDDHDLIEKQREINDDEIRVKYLDSEDIESLGWKNHAEYPNCFENYNYFLHGLGNNIYALQPKDLALHVDKIGRVLPSAILFQGTIKNKSELEKIMTMLMIK